jgi:transketolase
MATMTPACRDIRHNILKASRASGHGHIPTSFSVIEMLSAVYETMKHDPVNPQWDGRDIFILSKGHAALGYYAVLAHYGYFKNEELSTFGAFQSRLGCHPDRLKAPGAELSTGSLGHGIAVAAGIALAFQIQKSSRRVFTVIGDGECNEGSVWESIMVATHQRLANLTILLDYNHSQVRSLPIPNPGERLKAFGCETIEVNGHDVDGIKAAIAKPAQTTKAIVCNTTKGYGCPTLTNNVFEWHRKSPNPEQFDLLLKELETA